MEPSYDEIGRRGAVQGIVIGAPNSELGAPESIHADRASSVSMGFRRSAHSQTVATLHPWSSRKACVAASRLMLLSNFIRQKFGRVAGMVAYRHPG